MDVAFKGIHCYGLIGKESKKAVTTADTFAKKFAEQIEKTGRKSDFVPLPATEGADEAKFEINDQFDEAASLALKTHLQSLYPDVQVTGGFTPYPPQYSEFMLFSH